MKISITVILSLSLLFMAFGAASCPKKNVSQEVKIARAFTSAPVALKAAKDIVAVLRASNDVTDELKGKVDQVCNKTEAVVEQIAGDIRAGRFDADTQREWDKLLTAVLTEAQTLAPLIKKDVDPRFSEWINVALYTAPLFKSLIDQIKPPPAPAQALIEKDAKHEGKRAAAVASIGPGEVSAIVAISTAAAIKLITVQRDTDVALLWTKYDTYKSEYHSSDSESISVRVTKKGKTTTLK